MLNGYNILMMDLWGGVQVVVLINFFVKIWKK